MNKFTIPPLPVLSGNARYGQETAFRFNGDVKGPDGYVIKRIDVDSNMVICVPIQQLDAVTGQWHTIGTCC
ncbi:hypothetical protein OST27_000175 [Escherichia coli]|nr:hypothetical protein [Escherichia coli]